MSLKGELYKGGRANKVTCSGGLSWAGQYFFMWTLLVFWV